MKHGTIKNKPPVGDMGFDLEGRPLPVAPDAMRQIVHRALDDPDSQLIAYVLRHKGDLMLHILGPPSQETLTDLQQVLQRLVDGYAHILKGQ